jgi:hypothetical protein
MITNGNRPLRAVTQDDGTVALYHVMRDREDFGETAQALFEVVRYAITEFTGRRRLLYLDIEGHRNPAGGFDRDAYEIQNTFLIGFLMPYLSELHMPLGAVINPGTQRDDIPDELRIDPSTN